MQENFPKGHPISNYQLEAELIINLLNEITAVDIENEFQKFYNIFNELSTIEKRFERKENQLFPFLEKNGWMNPSRNMWAFHDNIRENFREIRKKIAEKDLSTLKQEVILLTDSISRLLNVENTILFPKSLEFLSDTDWIKMRQGEQEIGWMLKHEPDSYPSEANYIHPSEDFSRRSDVKFPENAQHYDEGFMTIEQVNLLFKTLPIDITFVDENDKVIFYNRGEERVFPRSAGIIGREVKFCHPPKSVDTVLRIVESFKSGEQNQANFWFNYRGRMIYIRYFAVRDKDKNYKGVIEMSQDITDIKQIEGERRLLEWD